ncbi:TlpA family protein disulfide reductase [Jhaorihella thermophila]|uniref:Thiol-disulfide isomerase or thioredoxin n=1 Tax=Jhaorihella thermophila TaxID=488547 RepID=A0A1H5W3P5_9RHOB|nr:TlpA disulfide reductase family protein [Jhaorihella thermophila]SEF93781.1 Thiol-disulfide isomerase or thioredoxin [Jhaorihella thermophila]
MRLIRFALLYLALSLGANAALATDAARLKGMATGDMRKLVFHDQPKPVSEATFFLEDGSEATLADFRGRYVLVNFWATWCAPCRAEMPTLVALQDEFGGDRFEVLTLATGRNRAAAIDRFFDKAGVTNLPRHTDPKMAVARDMNVLGLPVSVLIDPEGREIARLTGEADWHSDSARAIVEALLEGD